MPLSSNGNYKGSLGLLFTTVARGNFCRWAEKCSLCSISRENDKEKFPARNVTT